MYVYYTNMMIALSSIGLGHGCNPERLKYGVEMKLKLIIIFLSVVLILLMFGAGIVQGDDIDYPPPIVPIITDVGYTPLPTQAPSPTQVVCYPVMGYPEPGYQIYDPYPVMGYPEPIASLSEIELQSEVIRFDPIAPVYRNGRNLWQEIVLQFSKLLELMK
jgi:hypothetical protein